MDPNWLVVGFDAAARETLLFAAICFLIAGLDDFAIDLVYFGMWLRGRTRTPAFAELVGAPPGTDCEAPAGGRIVLFVPAWQEAAVIGQMLAAAFARIDHPDYCIYVGLYPNDRDTQRAVAAIAAAEPRCRIVIGGRAGPTTKADNLNVLWRALLRDEAAEGWRARAVVLHDAEDLVHPLELRLFDAVIGRADAVQLPVLPVPDAASRLVAGHYCDEFAEAHGKSLPVRQALGAEIPFAGTGCALRRDLLQRIADLRGGSPFDPGSLTEDYELGLTVAMLGGRTEFVRVLEQAGDRHSLICVRACFPGRVGDAVRQKARWMNGIALSGWDRIGWARARSWSWIWMRMRDRRATLAMPVLAIAYCALLLWGVAAAAHLAGIETGVRLDLPGGWLLGTNAVLLAWRAGVRALWVARAYGWREAAWSPARLLVSNWISLLAGRCALFAYVATLRGAPLRWDKTPHRFPEAVPA